MLPMMFKTTVLHNYGLKQLSSFLRIEMFDINIYFEIPHDVTKVVKNNHENKHKELAKMTNSFDYTFKYVI